MKRAAFAISIWALALGLAAPAEAGGDDANWAKCLQQDIAGPQDPQAIIDACRHVLALNLLYPNIRTDAFNNIGVAYSMLGKQTEALRAYSDALRYLRDLPDSPEVRRLANFTRNNRARVYIDTGEYADALEEFDTIAETEPSARYLAQRCWVHALYDVNFASALGDCQKAVDQDQQHAEQAYAAFLLVQLRQGKFADVRSDCKLVQDKALMNPDALFICALAQKRGGDAGVAQHMMEEARAEGETAAKQLAKLGLE